MQKEQIRLKAAKIGETVSGFSLIKKEYVTTQKGELFTLRHQKTGAELLYFDRVSENKTFSICFKTLPEDDTGVFHILEHSVLNGSKKFPVKEPFVSLLQSSMQTFLNAMTYGDKTVFPVSSRNEQDLRNLMEVYLDGVFFPAIYDKPEIFMQEGWHFEFDEAEKPFFNGVVFSEMKGVYSDVDRLMDLEISRLLFPDNSYGYSSGGDPEHITDLTYEQFISTHRRFYHPSNARIFLDGTMDVDSILSYIDAEYLSKFDYREPDFDFVVQKPVTGEKTVYYSAREGEENLPHMAVAKLLCNHDEVEKLYAAKILADYLTGSNEAPLKRVFLEKGLSQDISLEIRDGEYQPSFALVVRNTREEYFGKIASFLPETVRQILKEGLNREDLMASLERYAFNNREISEPYGINLAIYALEGWLYGDDPLTHIDNSGVFESLRAKVATSYFDDLLSEMLGSAEDKCYVYVLPSTQKAMIDSEKEQERVNAATMDWDDARKNEMQAAFRKMQQWQKTEDSKEALSTLPHLDLRDVPIEVPAISTQRQEVGGVEVLKVDANTNGIVYLNLYFDVSDFSVEELQILNAVTESFGELRTEKYSARQVQIQIKKTLGSLAAGVSVAARQEDPGNCSSILHITASMLEENIPEAFALLREILLSGRYDEGDRIGQTFMQAEYFMKQSMIGNGHVIAVTKALSPFSAENALKEVLEGETYVRWFGEFSERFRENKEEYCNIFRTLMERALSRNRLFCGFSGNLNTQTLCDFVTAFPDHPLGKKHEYPIYNTESSAVEIPGEVGFSAMGCNLGTLGARFAGSYPVLSSMMSFAYLWNMVRVQGGAYGTGMSIRANGDMFCYSYRDPNLESTKKVFAGMADFLEGYLEQGIALEDLIIGTVNTTDPLLDPAGTCSIACSRYIRGITPEDIATIRRELLQTTVDDLRSHIGVLREFAAKGRFCAVGNTGALAFLKKD